MRQIRYILLATALVCLGVQAYLLLPFLSGQTTLDHDNFKWFYPVFQFYVDSLARGELPLWNPYSHGGEPFYPTLVQLRLLEPFTLVVVMLGRLFTDDVVVLFNWTRYLTLLMMAAGTYWLLVRFARSLLSRVLLIPILLFSSFFLASFRQDGVLHQYMWVPWIVGCFIQIFYDQRRDWRPFLLGSLFLGLSLQSYWFTGIGIWLLFFLLGFGIFQRERLLGAVKQKGFGLKFGVSLGLLSLMALPNVVLLLEKDRFVFPARQVDLGYQAFVDGNGKPAGNPVAWEPHLLGGQTKEIEMSYSMIEYTGTFFNLWNWVQVVDPDSHLNLHRGQESRKWGKPQEAYLFLGLLAWLIVLFGMTSGRDPLKPVWLLTTVGIFWLMLGPSAGLHRALYPIFPPLWFLRHTHALVLLLVLGCLYFFVLGLDQWVLGSREGKGAQSTQWIAIFAAVTFGVLMTLGLHRVILLSYPESNWTTVWMLGMVVGAVALQRCFGQKWAFVGLVLAQLGGAQILMAAAHQGFSYLLLTAGVGWISFVLFRKRPWVWQSTVSAIVFCELLYGFHAARALYLGQLSPRTLFGADTRVAKSLELQPRKILPTYPKGICNPNSNPDSFYCMRYLSILERRPYVFSPQFARFEWRDDERVDFGLARSKLRWNAFYLLRSYPELMNSPTLTDAQLSRAFAVGESPYRFSSVDGSPHEIELDAFVYRGNSFSYTVTVPTEGQFYWADSFDPFWKVEVDSVLKKVERAQGHFKSVVLSAGTHVVRWWYQPTAFLLALAAFYSAFVLGMIGWLLSYRGWISKRPFFSSSRMLR